MAKKKITKKPHPQKLKLKTRVAIILDSSGSMMTLHRQAVDGFNAQVKAMRESAVDQDVRVSLVTFDNAVNAKFWDEPVEAVKALEPHDYKPNGGTALYDAVGYAVDRLARSPEASDPDAAFLLVIISDGEENASHVYSSKTLSTLLAAMQNTKRWTITYVGANQDLTKVQETLNIPKHNTMLFTASSAGYNQMSMQNNTATGQFLRSRGATGQSFSTSFYNPQDSQNYQGGSAQDALAGTTPETLADALKKAKKQAP